MDPDASSTSTPPSTPPAAPVAQGTPTEPRDRKRVDWVPLFVARTPNSPDSPVFTSHVLPPTPRRARFDRDASPSSTNGSLTDPDSPTQQTTPIPFYAFGSAGMVSNMPGNGGVEALSTSIRMSPLLGGSSPTMSRVNSYSEADPNARGSHMRRRSGSTVAQSTLDFPEPPMMERIQSLTTMMSGAKADPLTGQVSHLSKKRNSTYYKRLPFETRRRTIMTRSRLFVLVLFIPLFLYYLASLPIFARYRPRQLPPLNIPTAQTLINTIETVPYPLRTHPRASRINEYRTTSLNNFLATRLGSHFALPTIGSPTVRPSHLWLTVATADTVRTTALHLSAFVRSLDERGSRANPREIGEEGDLYAKRELVVVCRDESCMEFCRGQERMFCFGGYVGRDELNEEAVKLRAVVDVLEGGRRLFVVDSDVYFQEDPVPYLGKLVNYDLQIPDSWASNKLNAGFIFINPTSNVISLFQRILDISLAPASTWRSTNLLLNPSGLDRSSTHSSTTSTTEGLFDENDDAVASGYGQTEFESQWAGGIDVKVLDRARFRTSSGRLERMEWERERSSKAIYFHCVCCGDAATNDYIAGSLGYHQPSLVYPHLTPSAKVPHFPLVIKTPTLIGTPDQLSYITGMILQTARDSGRSFVPPLKGTLIDPTNGSLKERYAWRLFPFARWAATKPTDERSPLIQEPAYVMHAVDYLKTRYPGNSDARRLEEDIAQTLVLDFGILQSYEQMLGVLNRPYFSTTRIVMFENVDKVMGKPGWDLREEFKGLGMCEATEEGASLGDKCQDLCKVAPGSRGLL